MECVLKDAFDELVNYNVNKLQKTAGLISFFCDAIIMKILSMYHRREVLPALTSLREESKNSEQLLVEFVKRGFHLDLMYNCYQLFLLYLVSHSAYLLNSVDG